jgi:hypothetical protein
MTIYSFENNELQHIKLTSFNREGILERQHLQSAIKKQINVVSPDCLIISEEFSEWSDSQRRIDLLAIDKDANLVVIELKRNETGEHMELQAIRYAAMVSTLTFSRAVEIYKKYLKSIGSQNDAEKVMLDFLEWDSPREDDFALDVRIVLVSSDFSKELTTAVMWLNERGVDVRCVRLIPYKLNKIILVDVQQIIPLPEVESYQVKIRQQSEERREARIHSRDYTRYKFMGSVYNKRRLVLSVIHYWLKDKKPDNIDLLSKAFPQNIRTGGVFLPLEEAKLSAARGSARHFLEDSELIKFSNGDTYAISNQWGKDSIENFISQARSLGLEIEEFVE